MPVQIIISARLQLNAAIFYPLAISFGAEALVSVERIEEFLLKSEKSDTELGLERKSSIVMADRKRKILSLRLLSSG